MVPGLRRMTIQIPRIPYLQMRHQRRPGGGRGGKFVPKRQTGPGLSRGDGECLVAGTGFCRELFVELAVHALVIIGVGRCLIILARDVGPGRGIGVVELKPFFQA